MSGKKFKGPDFVRKHIENKHTEKIEEVKKEVSFFNAYLKVKQKQLYILQKNHEIIYRIPNDLNCLNIQIAKEVDELPLHPSKVDVETPTSILDLREISPEVQFMEGEEVTMEVVTEVTEVGEEVMIEDTVVDLLVEISMVQVLDDLGEVMEDSEVDPSLPTVTGMLPMMNIFNISS